VVFWSSSSAAAAAFFFFFSFLFALVLFREGRERARGENTTDPPIQWDRRRRCRRPLLTLGSFSSER
jgi:hypothetical protein